MTVTRTAIADSFSTSQQGWTREATFKVAGYKVRATVYRDNYDFQSRLYVEVWSPTALRWNLIQSMSGKDHAYLPRASLHRVANDADAAEVRTATQLLIDDMVAYAETVLEEGI